MVASESSGRLALSITAAGLAAGACALVAAILLPSGGAVAPPAEADLYRGARI